MFVAAFSEVECFPDSGFAEAVEAAGAFVDVAWLHDSRLVGTFAAAAAEVAAVACYTRQA